MRKLFFLSMIVGSLWCFSSATVNARQGSHSSSSERKIASFVYACQSEKKWTEARKWVFANKYAAYCMEASRLTGIAPEEILATGCVESHCSMPETGSIGTMQVTHGIYRDYMHSKESKRNLNIYSLHGNIIFGAMCLRSYRYGSYLPSRHEERLSRSQDAMWHSYNGGGDSNYVRKIHRVLARFRNGNQAQWEKRFKRYGSMFTAH